MGMVPQYGVEFTGIRLCQMDDFRTRVGLQFIPPVRKQDIALFGIPPFPAGLKPVDTAADLIGPHGACMDPDVRVDIRV